MSHTVTRYPLPVTRYRRPLAGGAPAGSETTGGGGGCVEPEPDGRIEDTGRPRARPYRVLESPTK